MDKEDKRMAQPNVGASGIRYGVIAFNNIDPDLGQELWYTHGKDLSWDEACKELRAQIERDADAIEEEVRIAIAEEDPSLVGNERWEERRISDEWARLGYDDREDYFDTRFEREREQIQIEEPVIEGEYEGVKYRIDWLGGAPLLWVLEGPIGYCNELCGPCVPNAGDLDSGFSVEDDKGWHQCYVVPLDWLAKHSE